LNWERARRSFLSKGTTLRKKKANEKEGDKEKDMDDVHTHIYHLAL
jgi:hypothetical protein